MRMTYDLMEYIHEIIRFKKIKDGEYLINLDEYADAGAHWIALLLYFVKLNCLFQ